MAPLIKVAPNLARKPVWLTGELDFDVEMTHGHLVQTSTGVRGGSARQFEHELRWGCERFKAWMEKEGKVYVELPLSLARAAETKGLAVAHGFIVDGPFLPMQFAASQDNWPRGGVDNEVLPRRRETSLAETGGKVCYRVAGLFLVKEHIASRLVEREKEPGLYAAIKHGRKRDGVWQAGRYRNDN